jgi:hypothetical protein
MNEVKQLLHDAQQGMEPSPDALELTMRRVRRRGSTRRAAAAAIAFFLSAGVGFGLWRALDGSGVVGHPPPSGSSPVPTPWRTNPPTAALSSDALASLPFGWTKLPPPPFTREGSVAVWTGRELIYWWGASFGSPSSDGATYDPARRTWTFLPDSPLSDRRNPAAVWTGSKLLIWGGDGEESSRNDGAAFDPDTGRWRILPEAPISARMPAAVVWTGTEMIIWGSQSRGVPTYDGAAYDPSGDTWRPISPAPAPLNLATGVWTGRDVLVFGSVLDFQNASLKGFKGLAYSPSTDSWRELPPYDLSPNASSAEWTGAEAVVWDYLLQAAALDPKRGTWRPVPSVPLREGECYPKSARVASLVFGWYCGQSAEYDPKRDVWTRLEPPAGLSGLPVSSGQVVFLPGSVEAGPENTLWVFKPASPAG